MEKARKPLVVIGLVYFEVSVPSASLDVPRGCEVFDERLRLRFGGALNSASVAWALGESVLLMYPAGAGASDAAVASAVRELGMPAENWKAEDDAAVSVVLEHGAERSFISRADFDALSGCPKIPAAAYVHVPGLHEARRLGTRLTEARRAGAKISVSGSWAPEELAQLAARETPWDLLFLNEAEATRAVGSPERALAALGRAASNVVVTLGARGAIGKVDGVEFRVSSLPTKIQDATGAGDAFAAGFLVGRLEGQDGPQAAALGAACSARQLSAPGGVARDRAGFEGLRRRTCPGERT